MALRTAKPGMRLPMRVWDAPVRLGHWLVVVLIAVSYVTSQVGQWNLHLWVGYAVLTLLLFRLLWGFVGSETARFRAFLVSPIAGLRHLAHFRGREPDNQVGHNEAGGWMVLILLALLAAQVGTGLFARRERAHIEAPLAHTVSSAVSREVSDVHGWLFYVLLAAIVLHVLAVAAYAVVKGHNLVRPMVSGKKMLPAATRAPRMAPLSLAVLMLALAVAAVALLLTQA